MTNEIRNDPFFMGDKYSIPTSVTIELCKVCNLRCYHCYNMNHNDKGLELENLFSLFKNLKRMGTFELVFTGGEIFTRDDIFEIIEYARKLGFDVVLFTNMTLLDEDKIDKLKNLYINTISTSIYSLNEEVHDLITGVRGSLKRALKNIIYAKQIGIPVEIKSMIFKDNINDIAGLHAFCLKNKLKYSASPFIFSKEDGDGSPLRYRINDDELKNIMPLVNSIVGFEEMHHNGNDFLCPSMRHSFGIDSQGNIFACNSLFISCGNILTDDVSKVWSGHEMTAIRNLKYKDLEDCAGCKNAFKCIRCPGAAYTETGSILKKYDYACKVAGSR